MCTAELYGASDFLPCNSSPACLLIGAKYKVQTRPNAGRAPPVMAHEHPCTQAWHFPIPPPFSQRGPTELLHMTLMYNLTMEIRASHHMVGLTWGLHKSSMPMASRQFLQTWCAVEQSLTVEEEDVGMLGEFSKLFFSVFVCKIPCFDFFFDFLFSFLGFWVRDVCVLVMWGREVWKGQCLQSCKWDIILRH